MKTLRIILQSLRESQFFTAQFLVENNTNKQAIVNLVLLKNGKKVQDQLLYHWQNTTTVWAQSRTEEAQLVFNNKERLSFLQCIELRQKYKHLCNLNVSEFRPVVFKTIGNSPTYANYDQSLFKLNNPHEDATLLVSDYFIPASNGLEKFYNIQRERKIWWMRYSANPSRYFVEPFDLLCTDQNVDEDFCKQCLSITIKSKFNYDTHDMESITLVPLNEMQRNFDNIENASSQVSLIRSVINLDLATCAMILDGSEHNRDNTLMLNRKLAPYQILLVYQHSEGKLSDTVYDFCVHLEHMLRRAGLRLYENTVYSNSVMQLTNELMTADNLGIPYTILIEENTIRTGLMKLRSRDTTLSETIHFSDIPNYLLNIFTH